MTRKRIAMSSSEDAEGTPNGSVYAEIIAVLKKMNEGCLVEKVGKQWGSGMMFADGGDVKTQESLSIELLKDRSGQLGKIVDILATLRDTAANARNALRVELSSRQGFAKLPEEIVQNIISGAAGETDWLFSQEWKYRNLRLMACVCRRFRNIINTHAPFWVDISNNMYPERVSAYLARSKAAPLSLYVQVYSILRMDSAAFLEKLLPHCGRWRSLEINYKGCFNCEASWRRIETMHSLLGGELHLPKLKSLTIKLSSNGDDDDDDDDSQGPSSSSYHPYTKWQAHNLSKMIIFGCLPSADVSFKLTHCGIFIDAWYWRCPEDPVKEFVAFLAGQPALEYLEVKVVHFTAETSYDVSDVLEMPALRTMSICVISYEELPAFSTSVSLPSIMQALKLPKVESLLLELAVNEDFEPDKLFPQFNDYTTLKKLHLALFAEYEADPELVFSPLETIYTRMSNLEELTLGASAIEMPLSVPEHTVQAPPLRSLCFFERSGISSDSILSVIQHLTRGPHWSLFKELRIRGCPPLHEHTNWCSSLPPHEFHKRYNGLAVVFNHEK